MVYIFYLLYGSISDTDFCIQMFHLFEEYEVKVSVVRNYKHKNKTKIFKINKF